MSEVERTIPGNCTMGATRCQTNSGLPANLSIPGFDRVGGHEFEEFLLDDLSNRGAFGALVVGLVRRMLPPKIIYSSMLDTAKTVSMIFVMIIGAFMFNAFLAVTQIPYILTEWIMALDVSRWVVLFAIILFYLFCGMFFNIWAVLILTIPVIYPAVDKLGFDLIWYSVIVVRVIEIGLVTPPFALNIFGLYGTIDASIGEMYRGIVPFVISDCVHVALLLAFPALCTWLPSVM